jgi:hypothetical protein
LALLGVLATALVAGSCSDPVHDQAVDRLGPEASGVPEGEYHRAGQPCVVCHEPAGPAKQEFSVAGTIFYGPNRAIGADQVQVLMIDSLGSKMTATTNCVGNFFVTPDVWNPSFPILVNIKQGDTTARMNSQISRDGSCATCHKDPPNFDSPGHVRLRATDDNVKIPQDCPVNPELYLPDNSTTQGTRK